MFVEMQHTSCVLVFVALVRGRKDCDQLPISEVLDAVHHTLVRADDVVDVVVLAERLHAVRPELHDVATLVRVAYMVGEDTFVIVRIGRI